MINRFLVASTQTRNLPTEHILEEVSIGSMDDSVPQLQIEGNEWKQTLKRISTELSFQHTREGSHVYWKLISINYLYYLHYPPFATETD